MKNSILFMITLLLSFIGFSNSHPGGTDSHGGHTCMTSCEERGYKYEGYHYHPSTEYEYITEEDIRECQKDRKTWEEIIKDNSLEIAEKQLKLDQTIFENCLGEKDLIRGQLSINSQICETDLGGNSEWNGSECICSNGYHHNRSGKECESFLGLHLRSTDQQKQLFTKLRKLIEPLINESNSSNISYNLDIQSITNKNENIRQIARMLLYRMYDKGR